MTKTQLRGNCQCCGRQQAVLRGTMAKHGYEVKDGWFQGVCQGHRHAPLQTSRTVADQIVAEVRAESATLRVYAAEYRAGTRTPATVKTNRYGPKTKDYVRIPFAEAHPFQRADEVSSQAHHCDRRAEMGEKFAAELAALADKLCGTPLIEVVAPEAPPAILIGERRRLLRGVATVRNLASGGKVRWVDERGFLGTSTTRAWRGYPLV